MQCAVQAQTIAHRGQKIVFIVVVGQVIQGGQPAALCPDRYFVSAYGHHVELAAIGGNIGGHPLT